MKALIQRVASAKVTVNGEEVSSIGRGILAFIGISITDTEKDVDYIARKILNLRLFEDSNGKRWAKSTSELQLEILCVSQFTLYHKLKGNKPDFRLSMGSNDSKILYEKLHEKLRVMYKSSHVKDGIFGAHMCVHIENDGPVTLELESSSTDSQ